MDLAISNDISRAKKYLIKDRHIGYNIICNLINNKLLFQEKQTVNAVFPMYDERNNLVGAELQGTTRKRFNNITAGSKYGYGFNIRFSNDETFDFALFFESAVDLISFMDFKLNYEGKSLSRCILVSMSGLKLNILRHTLKAFKGNLKPVLCVDNDEAGENFKKTIAEEKFPFMLCAPDEKFKDWNEQIAAIRTSNAIPRLMDNERGDKILGYR